jgi:hypothetical protein
VVIEALPAIDIVCSLRNSHIHSARCSVTWQ